MRPIVARLEGLDAAPFILVVGLVGGALQGMPYLMLGGIAGDGPRVAHVVIIGGIAVCWGVAALLLWWVAVRRRRWSVWATGAQVTLGMGLAGLLARALGIVAASILTSGAYAVAAIRNPWVVVIPNLALTLIPLPLWFLGSVMAVALGRHLMQGERMVVAGGATGTARESV